MALKVGPRGPALEGGISARVDYGVASNGCAVDPRVLLPDGVGKVLRDLETGPLRLYPRQVTTDLELTRTRGIRLFN